MTPRRPPGGPYTWLCRMCWAALPAPGGGGGGGGGDPPTDPPRFRQWDLSKIGEPPGVAIPLGDKTSTAGTPNPRARSAPAMAVRCGHSRSSRRPLAQHSYATRQPTPKRLRTIEGDRPGRVAPRTTRLAHRTRPTALAALIVFRSARRPRVRDLGCHCRQQASRSARRSTRGGDGARDFRTRLRQPQPQPTLHRLPVRRRTQRRSHEPQLEAPPRPLADRPPR